MQLENPENIVEILLGIGSVICASLVMAVKYLYKKVDEEAKDKNDKIYEMMKEYSDLKFELGNHNGAKETITKLHSEVLEVVEKATIENQNNRP